MMCFMITFLLFFCIFVVPMQGSTENYAGAQSKYRLRRSELNCLRLLRMRTTFQ